MYQGGKLAVGTELTHSTSLLLPNITSLTA